MKLSEYGYTQGPWKACFAPEHFDSEIVCDIQTESGDAILCTFDGHVDEDNQNAFLMAAAPTMFEALIEITRAYTDCLNALKLDPNRDEMVRKCRAALVAAIGVKAP